MYSRLPLLDAAGAEMTQEYIDENGLGDVAYYDTTIANSIDGLIIPIDKEMHPDRSIVEQPELAIYYEDFGSREANYAVRMYERAGFETTRENDEEYIMVTK